MTSSYTASMRFELIPAGERVNTWGEPGLNNVIRRVDFGMAGRASIVTSGGTYTLSSSNTNDDEARAHTLVVTGTGGTIIVPSVPKPYLIENNASGAVIISTGSGATITVDAGDIVAVHCTGSVIKTLGYKDGSGNVLSIKDYIAAQIIGATVSGLPAVAGNNGKFMYTNGASAMWRLPVVADVSDYASDQATKAADALGKAVAFAIAL